MKNENDFLPDLKARVSMSARHYGRRSVALKGEALNLFDEPFFKKGSNKKMKNAAQAAVTDALFLLVIISVLTGFLFLFAANYGKGVADQVNRNDNYEFVSSALKTIMYQSVPRDSNQVINTLSPDPDQELDYLMALVKEDYADDQILSENTQRNIARAVVSVMRPIADTQDYVFAMNTAQKYVFVMVWRTKFVVQQVEGKTQRFQNVQVDPKESHELFFCNPSLSDNVMQRLFLRVGNTVQAQALVNMVEFSGNSFLLSLDTSDVRAGVLLATWIATPIPDAEWALLKCSKISLNETT